MRRKHLSKLKNKIKAWNGIVSGSLYYILAKNEKEGHWIIDKSFRIRCGEDPLPKKDFEKYPSLDTRTQFSRINLLAPVLKDINKNIPGVYFDMTEHGGLLKL